jgi:hypothetical protein
LSNASQSPLALTGQTSPQTIKRYSVSVQKGQRLAVEVPKGTDVAVDIRNAKGQIVESAVKYWQDPTELPAAGQYTIDVIAQKSTPFTINVSDGAKNQPTQP